tara:strand:+ start:613 stop:1893 length:1281 start_codon:yes stop_codon:yes gene_type:complete
MTRRGVWDIQDVRDKLLAGDPWERYNNVFTGGQSYFGSLGQNVETTPAPIAEVTKIPTTADTRDFTSVRSLQKNKFAITSNNELFSWGYNVQGQLGQNTGYPPSYGGYKDKSVPVQIPGTTWDSVAGGPGRYGWFATKTDGTLWFTGGNNQLQQGTYPSSLVHRSSPIQVPGTSWAKNDGQAGQWKICTDEQAAFAIDTSGKLYAWGRNDIGNLGLNQGSPTSYQITPNDIGTDTTWQYVAASGFDSKSSTWAIKTDGTLWAWGCNDLVGPLGLNNTTSVSSPTQVGTDTTWSSISGGMGAPWGNMAMAMKTDGSVWAWGRSEFGASGTNEAAFSYSSPRQVPGTWDMAVTSGTVSLLHKPDGTGWIVGDLNAANMSNPAGGNLMSSPVLLPSAVDWDKDKMDICSQFGSYVSLATISPNLTPTQV